MMLDYMLHHHTSGVNAVAISLDGDRLLSGGKLKFLHLKVSHLDGAGDDADIVVWNILMGEKVQVIWCAFHGPIGALVWIPELPGLAPGFTFGCANGSIHVYQHTELSVHDHVLLSCQLTGQLSSPITNTSCKTLSTTVW